MENQTTSFRLGFSSVEHENEQLALMLEGSLPSWFSGRLIFNGPARFEAGKTKVAHLFDGLAMLHQVSIGPTGLNYTNKFLRSDDYLQTLKRKSISYRGFAQDPRSSMLSKLVQTFIPALPRKRIVQNSALSLTRVAETMIAATTNSNPTVCDPMTLTIKGVMSYADQIDDTHSFECPHPFYDAAQKETINMMTVLGQTHSYILYRIPDGKTTRNVIASIEIPQPSYIHSFSVTKNYIIIAAYPLTANPDDLIYRRKPFIENFRWQPLLGTTFFVVDRHNGTIIEKYTTTAFFGLHHVNAFEKDDTIVVDIVSYTEPSILGMLYMRSATNETDYTVSGQLIRYTIDRKKSMVWNQMISNNYLEFPAMSSTMTGKEYRYVYGSECSPQNSQKNYNYLVKIDTKTYQSKKWLEAGCYPSQPLFIEAPTKKSEDDGIVASLVLDTKKACSFILFLDAQNLTELARAYLPHHVPFWTHGIFIAN